MTETKKPGRWTRFTSFLARALSGGGSSSTNAAQARGLGEAARDRGGSGPAF